MTVAGETAPEAPRQPQDVSAVLNATLAMQATNVKEPSFGTNYGEWTVFGLARGGYYANDSQYFADYYDRIEEYVNEKAAEINLSGALDKSKSTDNSRLIMALAAIGKDATDVGKRTLVAALLILLCIPVTIFAGIMYLGNQHYNVTALLVLLECMLPFFLVFESRKPKARELVVIAVLCAIGVAGQSAFFMLPQFKPVMALVIIAGVAFGGETGFLVGAVTMLASNVLFSQGPWTPWQMFSMGIIGFLAGVLFRKGLLRRSRGSLATFGAFAAVIIYGGIMNPAAALMYNSQTINWEMLKAYYVSGLPMDLIHAAATVIFILIAAEPMLEKLDRIKVKYGLVE